MTHRPRLVPMRETVDTSSHNTVRSHKLEDQSRLYNEQYPHDCEAILRFDIPNDMGNKVGFRWNEYFRVYREDYKLLFSKLPLNVEEDTYVYYAPVMFAKKGGDPKSDNLFEEVDNVYTLLPLDFVPQWSVGDKIEWNYIHETENEERHIELKHSNYRG